MALKLAIWLDVVMDFHLVHYLMKDSLTAGTLVYRKYWAYRMALDLVPYSQKDLLTAVTSACLKYSSFPMAHDLVHY